MKAEEADTSQEQVFINFRGVELRYNFVSHLEKRLKLNKINVFIDTDEDKGQDLNVLLNRIEDSRIGLAIFSPRYTESEWCLKELAKMKERLDQNKLVMIPIFYKVEPSTVRELKGDFGDKFRELVKSVDKQTKTTWKKALKSVPLLLAFVLDEKSDEYELITKVVNEVKQVLRRLSQDSPNPPKNVVGLSPQKTQICQESSRGIEHPLKQQEEKLSFGSEETTTRTIGVVGMSGIGTTSIARRPNEKLKNSFLRNEEAPVPTSSAVIAKESTATVANGAPFPFVSVSRNRNKEAPVPNSSAAVVKESTATVANGAAPVPTSSTAVAKESTATVANGAPFPFVFVSRNRNKEAPVPTSLAAVAKESKAMVANDAAPVPTSSTDVTKEATVANDAPFPFVLVSRNRNKEAPVPTSSTAVVKESMSTVANGAPFPFVSVSRNRNKEAPVPISSTVVAKESTATVANGAPFPFVSVSRNRNKEAPVPTSSAVVAKEATVANGAPFPFVSVSKNRNEEAPVPTSSAAVAKKSAVADDESVVSKDLMVKSVGGFDLDGLRKASAEFFGKGRLGAMYKVCFDHGLVVAEKRLKGVVVPKKELKEKWQVLESLSHVNLVTLIAYHFTRYEKLVVFEYMSRGSLAKLLHGKKGSGMSPLNWETRTRIALGVSRAISYLHSRDTTTSHGNIKSSNILLSESFDAKVSDYCLTAIISPTYRRNHIDGYSAPEVIGTSEISQKADVYSFGVLLLELLTGKSPSDPELNEERMDLPIWVSSYVKIGTPTSVFDPELPMCKSDESENMIRLLKMGISCTARHPDKRPSMPEVTSHMEEISHKPGSEEKLSYGSEETTTRTIGITTPTRKLCKNLKNGFLKNEAPPVPTSSAAVAKESEVANDASKVSNDLMVKSFGGFDLDGLLKASAEVLGKGRLGATYKASFDHGLVVAEKRLKGVVVPEKELKEKLQVLESLSHVNLVTLIAYHFTRYEKLVVFEYMSRGSLAKLLHGKKGSGMSPLNWETRTRIALGAARAISYLHSHDATTCHGNIKSSNILLSESFEAKVSDYCLTPIISPTYRLNHVDGYSAPEVIGTSKISQKADVYSFGVLLLELLTGKSPSDQDLNEEGMDLPRWVSSYVKVETPAYVFDRELTRCKYDASGNMIRLLKMGISCTALYPDKRPSMPEVTRLIEEISC